MLNLLHGFASKADSDPGHGFAARCEAEAVPRRSSCSLPLGSAGMALAQLEQGRARTKGIARNGLGPITAGQSHRLTSDGKAVQRASDCKAFSQQIES